MVLLRLCLICVVCVLSIGCAHKGEIQRLSHPTAWVLSEGLCEPETIIHDNVTDRLIVSNICGFTRNNKGYLSVLSMDGALEIPRWVESLNAPAGMAILGRTLYVTDLDRVQMIDLDRGEVMGVIGPFPEARAFNDIAVDRNGTVYVSDSGRHKVIKIKEGTPASFPDETASFKFANGLHIQDSRLYVGGEGLWSVDLDTQAVTEIKFDGLADIDGIETDGQDGLIVSIVGGDIWHLPSDSLPSIWTAPDLSSTNHAYLPEQKLVLVPTGYDNTIIAFEVRH